MHACYPSHAGTVFMTTLTDFTGIRIMHAYIDAHSLSLAGTVFEATLTDFGAMKLRKRKTDRIILKRIISDEEAIRKNFAKKTLFGTSLVGGTVARGNFETGKVESYFNERVRR